MYPANTILLDHAMRSKFQFIRSDKFTSYVLIILFIYHYITICFMHKFQNFIKKRLSFKKQ